jgi:hypothetical protein
LGPFLDAPDLSGPLDDSDDRVTGGLYNPTGLGNKVSDHVNYYPWTGMTIGQTAIPTGLGGTATDTEINLTWNANSEAWLGGYKIYYGVTSGTYGNPVIVGAVTSSKLTGLATGTPYYIALSSMNSVGFESAKSPEIVVIPGMTITLGAPNGGESWEVGADQTIRWTYTGNPGASIKIELLKGSAVSVIKSSTSMGNNGNGSFGWTIPTKLAPRSDYKIRITSTSNASWKDASNGSFTINSAGATQSSAGPDQRAEPTTAVKLSGSNSVGLGKGVAFYQWTQLDGPPVKFSDAAAVETTFEAPEAGVEGNSLRFQLTVTDEDGSQSNDFCIVNVTHDNAPPTADAGTDQTVNPAEVVQLDGSGSSDGDDGIVAYAWQQLSGAPVAIFDPSAMQPTFVAPEVEVGGETLVFELTVTDQGGLKSRDTCMVRVSSINEPPTAQAGRDQIVRPGATVTPDGSGSMDEDDDIASWRWTQIAGRPVTLSDPTAVKPTFTAPSIKTETEKLVFQLQVTDAGGLQDKDRVTIAVDRGPSEK